MRFEWDPEKARKNLARHGISFELARRVWDDPFRLFFTERIDYGEERWHAIGQVGSMKLLVVIHTYPRGGDEHVRIIGARKASRYERRQYETEAIHP